MTTFIVNDLTDPHKLNQKYPNVHIIQDVYRSAVEVGFYVKLRKDAVYFWVQVKEVNGTTITGEIYHPLGFDADFTVGDLIIFEICYAFDIYDPKIFNLIPRIDQVNS